MQKRIFRPTALEAFGAMGLTLFTALLLTNAYLVYKHVPGIPIHDEWEYFSQRAIDLDLFTWLFTRHGEHVVAPTKLLVKILFWVGDWNVRLERHISFFIFSLIPVAFAAVARRVLPQIPVGVFYAFLIFFFSTVFYGTHFLGFLSQMHFLHVFKLCALLCLFHPSGRISWALLGLVCTFLTVVSFGAGTCSGLVILALFSLYRIAISANGRMKWQSAVLVVLAVAGVGAIFWSGSEIARIKEPGFTYPNTPLFWNAFFMFAGRALSLFEPAPAVGAVAYLLLVLVPLFVLAFRRGAFRDPVFFLLLTGVGATSAEMASLCLGRAKYVGPNSYYGGHYCEISFLILPWAAVLWMKVLENRRALVPFVMGLWAFFAFNMRGEFNFEGYYYLSQTFKQGVGCLKNYYTQGGIAYCPTYYPIPIADRLERARLLNVSFYRELMGDQPKANGYLNSPSPPLAEELRKIHPKGGGYVVLMAGRDNDMLGVTSITSDLIRSADVIPDIRPDFGFTYRNRIFPIEFAQGKVDLRRFRVAAVLFDRNGRKTAAPFPNPEMVGALERREFGRLGLRLVRVFKWEAWGVKRETELYAVE